MALKPILVVDSVVVGRASGNPSSAGIGSVVTTSETHGRRSVTHVVESRNRIGGDRFREQNDEGFVSSNLTD